MTREQLLDELCTGAILDRPRMENLYDRAVEALKLPGCFVECGTGTGHSSALLAAAIHDHDPGRWLYLYDTFKGLPPLEPGVDTAGGWTEQMYKDVVGSSAGSVELIRELTYRYGPRATVIMCPGLFELTLPDALTGPIALLHADADWYYSTRQILENLWPKVVPGGVVIFDDYHYWSGCKKAVDEYFQQFGVAPKWETVSCAVWGRKP